MRTQNLSRKTEALLNSTNTSGTRWKSRNEESRKKWLDFCGIDENVLSTVTKPCSYHFEENKLIHKSKNTFLKSNALPIITSKKRKKYQRLDCNLKKSKNSKYISEEIVNNGTVDKIHHNNGTVYNMTVNDGIVINDGIITNETAHITADDRIIDETIDNGIIDMTMDNGIVTKSVMELLIRQSIVIMTPSPIKLFIWKSMVMESSLMKPRH